MRDPDRARAAQPGQGVATRIAFVHVAGLFWTFLQYHLSVCARKVGATFIDKPVNSASEQIAAIETLLQEGLAVLLVHPMATSPNELTRVLRTAQDQGVQLICIDGTLEDSVDMCSVTADQFGGQASLAEHVFKRLGGKGKIAYLQGDMRTEAGSLRNKGLLSALERFPGIDLVFTDAYDWSSSDSDFYQGRQMGRRALRADASLAAIISATDEGALGVNAAIEECGRGGQIMLAGFDGTPEGITALNSGIIEVTARQPLETMAKETIQLALDLAAGNVKNIVHLVYPIELVTRESIGDAALKALRIFPEVTDDLNRRGIEQKNSAAFLDALLDNMPAMVVVKSARDLTYTRVNKAREEWLNVSRATQIGKSAYDFFPAETAARFQAEDRRILDRRVPTEGIEETLAIANTSPRIIHTRKVPILDAEGTAEYLLIISDDITPEKEAKKALAEHTEELEATNRELTRNFEKLLQAEKMAALGALVAGVAHELNTPIGNAVLAASTFADHTRTIVRKKESGLTRAALSAYLADASEGLAIMERNLHRAVELIQSFKQIAVDQTSSHTRRFLLDTLVSETLLTLSPSLKKSPIDVIRDIPTDIFLESFPGPLEQVLINLIDNAITHAFEGRTSGRIGISAKPAAPGWVEIVVEDDGVGISAENLRRIYDPFYTTKLGSGGAGLGLSVCQNVVTKILGGNIEVSSTPKVGTRFTISIPMQAGTSSNA